MTNRHLAYLLATTLLAAPVFAQTSSSPSSPGSSGAAGAQSRPGAPAAPGAAQDRSTSGQATSPPISGTTSGGAAAPGSSTTGQSTTGQPASPSATSRTTASSTDFNKPLAAPGPNQMMASDIRGTRVYGANNENVGDISDLLLDQDGEVIALVVGVGGFLGIGQKDVAIPFKAFEFVTEGQAGAGRTSTSSTGAAGSRTDSAAVGAGRSASGPATTGSTPGSTTSTTAASRSAGVLKPERIVLRGMTKADLESAPEFRKRGEASSSQRGGDSRSAPATTGGGSNR